VVARIMHAAPEWRGFLNVADKDQIVSTAIKAKSYSYLPSDFECVYTTMECMESKLFNSVSSNPRHVLHQL